MKITWDENKNTLNKKNHGVSFETAQLVFQDQWHMSRQDRIVDDEEYVRIISARLATRVERKIYGNDT